MKITSLGHTECLIECPLKNGNTWRLLLDSWLSDYSVADCMERAPQIKIDWKTFSKIDVVYISHSHMDHLDPYFLTELYRHQSPLLLLAETLAYLIPTLKSFLPETTQIETLKHAKTRTFSEEIEVTGILFVEDRISNEDDVMTLFVAHDDQSAFFEIDTIPPMIYEEQQKIVDLFQSKPFKSRVYVHSSNELEGNLKLFDYPTPKKRNAWMQEYLTARKEEILEEYTTMMEHGLPLTEIWNTPGFRSIFIGQGLQYPHKLSQELAGNKFFGLEEVTQMFKKIAGKFKITTPFQALIGGNSLDVSIGIITPANISGVSFVPGFPANTDHNELPFRAKNPLHQSEEIYDAQEAKILQALNARFLPTKIADVEDSLKQ
ncbi:MAG: MBL fold metallo-hydrolase, partial [Candidatus Gracilibacteria bacterium]|nr:MBL fold metallo-hydrolase [Candidatus Gracilibacteria bacterium]